MAIYRYEDALKGLNKPKPKPIRESAIVSTCIKWLWHHNCFVWRNNTGAWKDTRGNRIKYGYVGSADILGVNPYGVFLAIECKSGNNEQTDPQIKFQKKIEEQNGIYVLAYSVDDLIAHKQRILSA